MKTFKKHLRHFWIRFLLFVLHDPLARVEFDENDVPHLIKSVG